MIKAFSGLILLLLAIGVGLSLYLPPYSDNMEIVDVPLDRFTLLDDSLTTPYKADTLRYSHALLDAKKDETFHYGLQLGIFSSLEEAMFSANKTANTFGTLAITPSIFGVQDQKRQWFVVALGPLENKHELTRYQRLLNDHYITGTSILWPTATE